MPSSAERVAGASWAGRTHLSGGAARAPAWVAIALMALGVRAALAIPALGDVSRFYVAPDSYEYEQLAVNLLAGHGYSQADASPYPPDVRRTPVYPLLLAAVYALAGQQPGVAVGANVLLGVLACVLTVALASRLFGSGPGVLAGLLLALDLTSAAYSLVLMTETLFTVVLLLAVLAAAIYLRRGGARPLALAALGCGVATLVRPIGVFLPVLIGPALALLRTGASRRARVLCGSLFVLLALALPLGWTVRNYQAAGVAQLTSLVAINAYYHRAAAVEAQRRGVPAEVVRRELAQRRGADGSELSEEPADLAAMERRAWETIRADPIGYAVSHLQGVGRLLGPDREVSLQLRAGGPRPSGSPESLAAFVTADPAPHVETVGPVLYTATLQLALVYGLAAVGLAAGLRRPADRPATLLLLIVLLYFLAVSGPEAYARFRVPMMPFVALLAAVGARSAWASVSSARGASGWRLARLGEEGRR